MHDSSIAVSRYEQATRMTRWSWIIRSWIATSPPWWVHLCCPSGPLNPCASMELWPALPDDASPLSREVRWSWRP